MLLKNAVTKVSANCLYKYKVCFETILICEVPFAPKYIHKNIFSQKKLNNYILQKFVQIFAAKYNVQRYTVCVVFVGQRL